MMRSLLIANRGEIACRIIRTAQRMGIRTVLAASDADRNSLAATMADVVSVIGPAPAMESYLRGDRLIAAALETGAEAIHPGYGFLAENAAFAESVLASGLIWIGPPPDSMRQLGSKAAAKHLAVASGVPVVPGFMGDTQDATTLQIEADSLGYPLLIKAVDGGGGRGMRRVDHSAGFPAALESARREAAASFGNDRVLIERVIQLPRHIEIQVFADAHGNALHLMERECSLQRRNQKVMEEAPAPGMSEELRARMCDSALRLIGAAGYQNAGTVEFLVAGGVLGPEAPYCFIEANIRLQVEHPVTEAITGLDLVEWQLRVAAGEPLPLSQDEIRINGHAVEVRINAEDPVSNFLPSSGRLAAFDIQADDDGGVRVDSGFRTGDAVTRHYDSLLAKLIVHGTSRQAAIARAEEVLTRHCHIAGIRTNIAFAAALLADPDVTAGLMDTGLIERKWDALTATAPSGCAIDAAAGVFLDRAAAKAVGHTKGPWGKSDAFQLGSGRRMSQTLTIDDIPTEFDVTFDPVRQAFQGHTRASGDAPRAQHSVGEHGTMSPNRYVEADGFVYALSGPHQIKVGWPVHATNAELDQGDPKTIRAPITGQVVEIAVETGAVVAKGDRIVVIEAMKMEHILTAAIAGTISDFAVSPGDQVAAGQVLVRLEQKP